MNERQLDSYLFLTTNPNAVVLIGAVFLIILKPTLVVMLFDHLLDADGRYIITDEMLNEW